MRSLRWLALALVVAVTLPARPPSVRAGEPPANFSPLGSGARFLSAGTAFYLAADLHPESEQLRFLDRLAPLYLRAPEAQASQERLAPLGLGASLEELLLDRPSWLGGEVFMALPTAKEYDSVERSPLGGQINVDCGEPRILAGVAIGDMPAFLAYLSQKRASLETEGVRTGSERYEGVDIHWIAGRSPEAGVYLAVHQGYLLLSTNRSGIIEAVSQDAQGSLAASPAFQDAVGRFPSRPLAFLYTSLPDNSVIARGGSVSQESPVQWVAGALNVGPDRVTIDTAASVDEERLTPATRALLAKKPNPLNSARAVPTGSVFFAGWDNIKLMWDLIVETNWPEREDYDRIRQQALKQTGLDLDDDVFGWMTGELGIFFMALSPAAGEPFGALYPGLVLEAKDPQHVKQKLDKIIDSIRRLSPANMQPTVEEIAGVPFQRVPVGPTGAPAIYGAVVDNWLIVAPGSEIASDTVAAVRGQGGLARHPEYSFVRAALPGPVQFLGYVNIPEALRVSSSSAGAPSRSANDEDAPLHLVRGAGLAVRTSVSSVDGAFFAHVIVPDEPLALPSRTGPEIQAASRTTWAALDVSRHGGAWRWGDSNLGPRPPSPLERFLRNEQFVRFTTVIFPGESVGRMTRRAPQGPVLVRPDAELLVRVGSQGEYTQDELTVYRDYVRCGGVLLLLSDGKAPGETDSLAEAFGMQAVGVVAGEAVIDYYSSHPATNDLPPLGVPGGAGLIAMDDFTRPLGFLSTGSFLDLDGNKTRTRGEPLGSPALALRHYGRGSVVFLGTTSIVATPDHPLLGSLLRYLLPDAPRRPRPMSAVQELALTLHDRFSVELAPGTGLELSLNVCRSTLRLPASDLQNILARDLPSEADENAGRLSFASPWCP